MTDQSWKAAPVEMLTEVSILGSLIKHRINALAPEGLNEAQFAILSVLGKCEGFGIARESLIWTLERGVPDIVEQVNCVISRGFAEDVDGMLNITELGRTTFATAVSGLFPSFEPALQGLSAEQMAHVTEAIREIRRTLDNLPL